MPTVLYDNSFYFCSMITTKWLRENEKRDKDSIVIFIAVVASILVAIASIIGFIILFCKKH